MKRRSFLGLFGAVAGAAVVVPGTSIPAPTTTPVLHEGDDHYGYFVRGTTDFARNVRVCPIMPDDDGDRYYLARVHAWFAGWTFAEKGGRL
jgi:hypothetical protein